MQLDDATRAHAVSERARRARSGQRAGTAPQLIAHVHSTLHTGDARILPEALFALHDAPTARER